MRVLGQFRIVEHPGGKVPADPHDDPGVAPGGVLGEAAGQPEAEQAPEAATSTRTTGARSAAELFAAANVARREGEVGKAARLYRELVRRHAWVPEGLVARVTFGRLLLDRLGDARGALREFDAYLGDAKQGTLRKKTLIGRALVACASSEADPIVAT